MAGAHADGVLPLLYPPERFVFAREHVLAGAAGRAVDVPACFWVSLSGDAGAPAEGVTLLGTRVLRRSDLAC